MKIRALVFKSSSPSLIFSFSGIEYPNGPHQGAAQMHTYLIAMSEKTQRCRFVYLFDIKPEQGDWLPEAFVIDHRLYGDDLDDLNWKVQHVFSSEESLKFEALLILDEACSSTGHGLIKMLEQLVETVSGIYVSKEE